jgi:glycosyltransferase involved in cell wall biosynthesis
VTPAAPERAGSGARPEDVVPQRCTIVLPSTGQFDSRAWRIASTLASRGHRVTVMARGGAGVADEEMHQAGYRIVRVPVSAIDGRRPRPRPAGNGLVRRARTAASTVSRLGRAALAVRSQLRAARRLAPGADLIHAMAYMGIPIGLDLGRRDGAPVVYDARDIYVDAGNVARLPDPLRRLFGAIEGRWARRASRVTTVNEPYADVLERRFGRRPLVVMNCSYRRELPVVPPRRFHERLRLDPAVRVVLYHGGFSPERGIEQLIEGLPSLPNDAVLVLLGYGVLQAELDRRSAEPGLAGRLFVLPAVDPPDLLDWVGSADVVAAPIQPSTLNHRLTTPNKLFEAMAAGVPIAASDLPGMAGIVRETGCGVLFDPTSPISIATAIRSILDTPESERLAYRDRALAAAHGRYSWEAQAEILLGEYGRLTGRPW